MKIKLTKRWKRSSRSHISRGKTTEAWLLNRKGLYNSSARWGSVLLECEYDYLSNSFYGRAYLKEFRDGTKALMEQHGIDNDN